MKLMQRSITGSGDDFHPSHEVQSMRSAFCDRSTGQANKVKTKTKGLCKVHSTGWRLLLSSSLLLSCLTVIQLLLSNVTPYFAWGAASTDTDISEIFPSTNTYADRVRSSITWRIMGDVLVGVYKVTNRLFSFKLTRVVSIKTSEMINNRSLCDLSFSVCKQLSTCEVLTESGHLVEYATTWFGIVCIHLMSA